MTSSLLSVAMWIASVLLRICKLRSLLTIVARIKRDRATCTLTISQEQYTKRLLERYLPAAACRREDGVTLTLDQCPEEGSAAHLAMAARRADYMSMVGALLWLAAGTRPDITFAACPLLLHPGRGALLGPDVSTWLPAHHG